ncbi:MAG: toprim domain-containing protein [Planctomycetota bacterium]|nr:toprim domain-containing protein [Planctomycetota bacterium]
MPNESWRRVSLSEPCRICGKKDWCLESKDGILAICSRIEGRYPAKSSAGWLHRLKEDDQPRDAWRPVRTTKHVEPRKDLRELAKNLHRLMNDEAYRWLSNRLGVSIESLQLLRTGWHRGRRSFSFPMRSADGQVVGIRYRATNDSKFSERGGREGLFFQPTEIAREYLLIVEGASDAASCITIGFPSVIGRANCTGNVNQILSLCRRLNPHRVILIPDNDRPGIKAAESLASALPCEPSILHLPSGIKDVRQCISETKKADWLRDQIGKLIQTSSTKGDISNDQRLK